MLAGKAGDSGFDFRACSVKTCGMKEFNSEVLETTNTAHSALTWTGAKHLEDSQ